MLLHADAPLDAHAELLLMLADRAQHVAEVDPARARARRGRGVRPLRAVDARVPGRRARARGRRGRAPEQVGGGRARARRRDRARPPRRDRRGAGLGRSRPLRTGGRRLPRPGPGRVSRTRARRGAGCSSTPTAPPTKWRRGCSTRWRPSFRRLGGRGHAGRRTRACARRTAAGRGAAGPRVPARRSARFGHRGRGARVRGDVDRRRPTTSAVTGS